jgi:hypothetical protein
MDVEATTPRDASVAKVPRLLSIDVCRIHITLALHSAGWMDEQIREQATFTYGRIIPAGQRGRRKGN